jgi:hypothetical protein
VRPLVLALLLASFVPSASGAAAQQQQQQQVIRVPEGRAVPVLLDGRFSPGEWDDAAAVRINDSMRLMVKQVAGHVYVAVASGARAGWPVDLYLRDASGVITQLHASMQIGERVHRDTLWAGETPAWRWGNHVDWIANEMKLDMTRPPGAFAERLFPGDGTEYQIRRSRFGGREWRVRLEVQVQPETATSQVLFPRGATRDTATWAVLRME